MTTQTQARPVASRETANAGSAERVDFHYHPRLIRALGAELVTSDIVAIIELVKNSYDAFAHNVTIRFAEDAQGEYIEIEDDGLGMTRDVIEDAWFTVATPHKVSNPTTRFGARQRRVSGDKGLGRLSAARLGGRLEMITKAKGDSCWRVEVQWSSASDDVETAETVATISEVSPNLLVHDSGTHIRISDLSTRWTVSSHSNLENSLARLISPFGKQDEFNIILRTPTSTRPGPVKIESPEFLSNPPYRIKGTVDASGNVQARYSHSVGGELLRFADVNISWYQIYQLYQDERHAITLESSSPQQSQCGPFEFEIRAWDLNVEERQVIESRFRINRREIQRLLNANRGIALYRDGVLVLPKTEEAQDWLGLDARRIQRVGPRIGTRNVIGQVNIDAKHNPDIRDTSDREALATSVSTDEFRCIIMAAIFRFESERNHDRDPVRQTTLKDVFSEVSADSILRRTRRLATTNGSVSEIIPAMERHASRIDRTREDLRNRFAYYGRVAAMGQIAHMLVHEILNRTTAIGMLLSRVRHLVFRDSNDNDIRVWERAKESADSLEALAHKFLPLSSRQFKSDRQCIVEDQIRYCLDILATPIRVASIRCEIPNTSTHVAVDPGELTHVLYNLVDNAVYWLGNTNANNRRLSFHVDLSTTNARAHVIVSDNGPGVSESDIERVFLPGISLKPNGTGMGLTVASELVATWNGQMKLKISGDRQGATFEFDVPSAESKPNRKEVTDESTTH